MPRTSPRSYRLIFSTCPNARVAKKLATTLVKERLAACVNIVPGMRSIYRWQGNVETAGEVLMIIKARAADYPRIEKRLRALHPYELPEILAVGIQNGLDAYLRWIEGVQD
jgi:periplasmic divalent cation tolerance protein